MALSLCIAGCGGYARIVASAIQDMSDTAKLYFASRTLSKAKEYNDEFGGAGFFGSYEDAAADSRIDAMYFFTPHHLHLENARLAARHGKHVMIEKPIARTPAEGQEIIRAAETAGVKLMIAENYRFLPAAARCKELIADGTLGELRLINLQYEMSGSKTTGWRRSLEYRGGGVLIDGTIHIIDLLVNLGGLPTSVFAAQPPTAHPEAEGDDGTVLACTLPGGAMGLINYSNGTPIGAPRRVFRVTGTKAEVEFDPFGTELTVTTAEGVSAETLPVGNTTATRAMVQEFADCIVEDRAPAMSGEEALKDLAVVMAAYQSVETGKAVTPDV